MMPSEVSPCTAPTLPVHVAFLPARRPPSDLQVCSEPVMVPDLHPASTSAQTTTRMGAYTTRPNICVLFMCSSFSPFRIVARKLARRSPGSPTSRRRPTFVALTCSGRILFRDHPRARFGPALRAARGLRAPRCLERVHRGEPARRGGRLRRPDPALFPYGVLERPRLPGLPGEDGALRGHPRQPRHPLARVCGTQPRFRRALQGAGPPLQVLQLQETHLRRPEPFAGGARGG